MNKLLFKHIIFIVFLSFLMPGLFSKKSKKSKKQTVATDTTATINSPDSTRAVLDTLLNQAENITNLLNQTEETTDSLNQLYNQDINLTQSFGLEELNIEMQKIRAELDYYIATLREMQTKGKMFGNPLEIYDKEIILNNGTTIFGKILYQDRESIKVETLIGNLIVSRKEVVRVIDNKGILVTETESLQTAPGGNAETKDNTQTENYIPKDKLQEYNAQQEKNVIEHKKETLDASLILSGDIVESKDMSGNIILQGEIKNVGTQRADFVKIVFSFRTDWAGESKTKVAFAKGTKITLEEGETIDSSIMPGAVGAFKLIIPKDFGVFIGYSYVLDWAQIN